MNNNNNQGGISLLWARPDFHFIAGVLLGGCLWVRFDLG
jgi:hypothetical protein